MAETFMQAVHRSVREAVNNEPGASQLKGVNKEHVVQAVSEITKALDGLAPEVNLHVVLFALSYVRNSVVAVMKENEQILSTHSAGQA